MNEFCYYHVLYEEKGKRQKNKGRAITLSNLTATYPNSKDAVTANKSIIG